VGDDFHLCLKSIFEPFIFFSYQVTNPLISRKKIILILKFIFIIILLFLKVINLIQTSFQIMFNNIIKKNRALNILTHTKFEAFIPHKVVLLMIYLMTSKHPPSSMLSTLIHSLEGYGTTQRNPSFIKELVRRKGNNLENKKQITRISTLSSGHARV
jgi:hypothetical protein